MNHLHVESTRRSQMPRGRNRSKATCARQGATEGSPVPRGRDATWTMRHVDDVPRRCATWTMRHVDVGACLADSDGHLALVGRRVESHQVSERSHAHRLAVQCEPRLIITVTNRRDLYENRRDHRLAVQCEPRLIRTITNRREIYENRRDASPSGASRA